MKNSLILCSLLAIPFGVTACGDDSSSSSQNDREEISSAEDLGNCTSDIENKEFYQKDQDISYVCQNGEWVKITSTPNSSSSTTGETVSSDSEDPTDLNGWSWKVPKDLRLNPKIDYKTMTDSRDNKVYKTVVIGDKTWMAENLNYSDSVATPSLIKRSHCYGDEPANCDVGGRLYTWAAAIDSVKTYDDTNGLECGDGKICQLPTNHQGICPPGWHLPSYTDWEDFIATVGGPTAGAAVMTQNGWDILDGNENGYGGTDIYGFSAIPVGTWGKAKPHFFMAGIITSFWSSYENDTDYAYSVTVDRMVDEDVIRLSELFKAAGLSVRCVKN